MGSAEVAVPIENISTLQPRLLTAKEPALPEQYFQQHLQRYVSSQAQIASDRESGFALPVVDLAGLRTGDPSAREEIARQVGNAASKWGFFQVINHGVSEEILDEVDQQTRQFFQLPVNVKERAVDPDDLSYGYNGTFKHKLCETPWLELWAQWHYPKPKLEAVAEKVWPGGNPTFCNVLDGWLQGVDRLGHLLLVLLAESLGLKPDTFSKEFQDPANYSSAWRLHRYPACPDPSRILGARPHSDPGVITILKQDAVGGLQIRDGDRFVDVPPVPGALVVNIGDTLQIWSNGRFRSCDHRVVVNGQSDRYSMVYLIQGARPDFVVQSPPELIDEAHPALYVPCTYAEYRGNHQSLYARGVVDRQKSLAFALRKD